MLKSNLIEVETHIEKICDERRMSNYNIMLVLPYCCKIVDGQQRVKAVPAEYLVNAAYDNVVIFYFSCR